MIAVPSRAPSRQGLAAALVVAACLLPGLARAADTHPIVAGFERFGADPKLGPALGGKVLLGELGCTACHRAAGAAAAWIDRKAAPVLDHVGGRVRPDHLRAFLADPHGTKPGTTMPDLLAALPANDRGVAAEALTAFLGTTGRVAEKPPSPKQFAAGRTLYRQVGCLTCHGPLDPAASRPGDAVPLGNLADKYTVPGLAAFLREPHEARPSGRMPGMRLTRAEANSLACALLAGQIAHLRPNLTYSYYEGDWESLPDFAALKPAATGECFDFDLTVARRPGSYGLRFRGELRIDRDGDYNFHLRSDDGARLTIDDAVVTDNDGIHPPTEKAGKAHLTKGPHGLVVDFFQGGGEAELDLSYSGPGLPRQDLSPTTAEPATPAPAQEPDAGLVSKGRDLFATLGCASCHQLKEGDKAIEPTGTYPALADLRAGAGCLNPAADSRAPRFGLDDAQRAALVAALAELAHPAAPKPSAEEVVARTLTALNCVACHARGDLGGPDADASAAFETTQPEMGDEGRLPPRLDGVGAKLRPAYLAHILADGAKDRPYMLTRMPNFGAPAAGHLAAHFEMIDRDAIPDAPPVGFSEPERKVKAAGRFLVGGQALNCIACHTFKDVQAQGIQAIDMTTMTRRLRREWFHRYLPDPAALRPGTRMPTSWPGGQTMLPDLLGGSADHQIEAIWNYLADGRDAALPIGLGRDPMPLVPGAEAIIDRNFIEGAGSRAIGVGYPEHVSLAFDAADPRLALIWQGAFIDASRHWVDRGVGFQPPLGDNVVALPPGPAFAPLSDPSATPWPPASPADLAAHFRGYRLGASGKPTFLYDVGPAHVEDAPDALPAPSKEGSPSIRRILTLTSPAPLAALYFRAAVADAIEPLPDGWYSLGGGLKMRLRGGADPALVRKIEGKVELLVPVNFRDGRANISQEIDW